MPFTQQKNQVENLFRRHGIDGEDGFYTIAYCYAKHFDIKEPPNRIVHKGQPNFERFEKDSRSQTLDAIVSEDKHGDNLPLWYQHFVGRKFREGSGKFFTPRTVAEAMASFLPLKNESTIMDPTCGGGTFLVEASKMWRGLSCQLIGNDIDASLVDLAQVVLDLGTPWIHKKAFLTSNIYEPDTWFQARYGKVDYILANPPFSLEIASVETESRLYELGYRNSDALFIDICYRLLRPKGRLVCLLPHSIIANAEFQRLRSAVEEMWNLLGVISLPEGIFYVTAGTTTRADIVILEKTLNGDQKPEKMVFASAPSAGVPLNSRMVNEVNCLRKIATDIDVRAALGVS